MFSWSKCPTPENKEKADIKVLHKSDLSKLLEEKHCFKSRANIKPRCDEKTMVNKCLSKSNSTSKKNSLKILDLSPEEKEKIAALIRELGVIQLEKERLSHELTEERNKFQVELASMEKVYKSTLEDKDRLQEELRRKEERCRNLEISEGRQSTMEHLLHCSSEHFVVIPKKSLISIEETHSEISTPGSSFPGPPKSSRSHKLTSELLRAHSPPSIDRSPSIDRHSLLKEQSDLLVERRYLSLVLKQQKCLRKLKTKIDRLEKKSEERTRSSVNHSEASSVVTDRPDAVPHRILNEAVSEMDSLSQSVSVCSPSRPPTASDSPLAVVDRYLLKDDDLLLITALNETSPANLPRLASPSPPSDHPPPSGPSEDDLLNDLFFNL